MLKEISRNHLVGFWFAAVAVAITFIVAMDVNVAVSTTALLLTVSLVPPAIMFLVWRGAPPPTIREILYSVNTPKTDRA